MDNDMKLTIAKGWVLSEIEQLIYRTDFKYMKELQMISDCVHNINNNEKRKESVLILGEKKVS